MKTVLCDLCGDTPFGPRPCKSYDLYLNGILIATFDICYLCIDNAIKFSKGEV